MTDEQVHRLWDEINVYAESCGGTPGSHAYGNYKRMDAVVAIENLIAKVEAAARREGMKEALRWVMDHRARFSDYGLIEKFHEALRRVEEGEEL